MKKISHEVFIKTKKNYRNFHYKNIVFFFKFNVKRTSCLPLHTLSNSMAFPLFILFLFCFVYRRSLRHLELFQLTMIMTFLFNKLFPSIPPLPPKTYQIKFINQGLDLLNIFRDHRVTFKISQYFENLDPPLICHQ